MIFLSKLWYTSNINSYLQITPPAFPFHFYWSLHRSCAFHNLFAGVRRALLNFHEFMYIDLVIKSSGQGDLFVFPFECQEKARGLQLENLIIVSLTQGKGNRMSLTSGYMRTAHLAGLIKKMEYTSECESLRKYLYPTRSLLKTTLSLCEQHRVADHSENTVQKFVASPGPFWSRDTISPLKFYNCAFSYPQKRDGWRIYFIKMQWNAVYSWGWWLQL